MKLSFAVHNDEYIRVNKDNNSLKEVTTFFDNEFNLLFKDNQILIPFPIFMQRMDLINSFLHDKRDLIRLETTEDFRSKIALSPRYRESNSIDDLTEEEITSKISSFGFKRIPTKHQFRNLQRLCALRACASFSVPGAGKTTEALAFHAFHAKNQRTKLLVISPINAFTSWDDEFQECYEVKNKFTRLRGSVEKITELLNQDPQFIIINYDSLRSPEKFSLIKKLVLQNSDMTVILDESHKSKGQSISFILSNLSPFISHKVILTGTPMPQAPSDLRPQFNFLYPNEYIQYDEELIEKFSPVYVRTTKRNLDLLDPIYKLNRIEPRPVFSQFYNEYFAKPLSEGATLEDILAVRSFKKAVLKLIKFISNPASCADDIMRIDPSLLNPILEEGSGAKIDALVDRATDLINQGEKVLIWSSFINNVELLASRFGDKAEYIHGGVKTASNDEEDFIELDTREAKIKRFKEDESCRVLVANPAAAAESISLHKHCNHALYLDRTYNAGQFLQSQDRIHRYIAKEDEQQKYIDIFLLNIPHCVDFKVHDALNRKIENMAAFLNDPSLISLHGFDYDLDQSMDDGAIDEVDKQEFYAR